MSLVPYPHPVHINIAAPTCARSVEDFSYRKCINRLLRDDWDASLPRMLQFRSWVTRIVAAPEAGPQEVSGCLCQRWVCGFLLWLPNGLHYCSDASCSGGFAHEWC